VSRDRVTLGKIGENLACDELRRRGYAILARRYRRRGGEIDIVAEQGRTVVFVEVKTRAGVDFGSGADAITWIKRRRMVALAGEFMVRERLADRPCRFDVVSIVLGREGPGIEVYINAFDAGGHSFASRRG
jgi:putative endonuclease